MSVFGTPNIVRDGAIASTQTSIPHALKAYFQKFASYFVIGEACD
jgi:hypothetical protein